MGKAEERCRVDRTVVCKEGLIWFEGCPWLSDITSDGCGFLVCTICTKENV